MKIQALNGFKDILPEDIALWRRVEKTATEILGRFHFSEIRLPILEQTRLFSRSIGEATDIVEKEMYTFVDKQITMRPEATASMVRAYIEHGMHVQKPVQRLFTIGPMFRHERPQKGRLRQFHQMDVEILGSEDGRVDAELIAMASMLFKELDIGVSLELNSLGCPDCRPGFRRKLLDFLESIIEDLCEDCKRRVATNPLRVLDCKNKQCRHLVADAPSLQDNLCAVCSSHFDRVKGSLNNLDVEFSLNKFMVRGLDYYCRTTFEFITTELGTQSAVCAGGRYDGLVELLGGPKIPGIGFAMGIERLVLLLQQTNQAKSATELDLFIAGIGEKGADFSYVFGNQLRRKGLRVAMDHEGRSLKALLKQADKSEAPYVLIIGEEELVDGKAVLKNMQTQEQQRVTLDIDAVQEVLSSLIDNRYNCVRSGDVH